MRMFKDTRTVHAALLLAGALLALGPTAAPAYSTNPSALVGQVIPDFTLPDFDGTPHSLAQSEGEHGTVLIFISTRCPVSNAYNERMVALAKEYQAKGFEFFGINANKAENPAAMKNHARSHHWNFTVLKDENNVIADRFSASVTPEAFVIDNHGVLRYHGRIDDSQDESDISSEDLREALDAIITGRDVVKKEAKAFGCSIKRQ